HPMRREAPERIGQLLQPTSTGGRADYALQVRWELPGGCPLREAQIRDTHRADGAVAPGLGCQPLDRVVTVHAFVKERVPDAVGIAATAHVLDGDGVAMPCEIESAVDAELGTRVVVRR